jgi:hypothetical protein
MSDDTTTKVTLTMTRLTLTLRKSTAERLRAMCHARGETASELLDRWILSHGEKGECRAAPASPTTAVVDKLTDLFRGRGGL